MSDRTRNRINAAFDDELSAAPVPPSLRHLSVRAAIAAPRPRSRRPELLALVAAVLVIALVASLVIGVNALRTTAPAHPTGSTLPPPSRAGAMVAFDEAHGQMVVFGGQNPALNDTWTFDGKLWTHHRPAASPTPRSRGAMAYDVAHRDVVLFGGLQHLSGKGGSGEVEDTWIWDGSTWHEMHPAHVPALAFESVPGIAFDHRSERILMYGYTRGTSEAQVFGEPQTWSWDGADWTQLTSGVGPKNLANMTFDGKRVLLLAYSAGMEGGRNVIQTWSWNGSTWILLHPPVDLPSEPFPAASYDAADGQLVVVSSDTWTWDGSRWSRQHPTVQPPIGYMAYMPSLREVISWGDAYGGHDVDTWAWNGTNWILIVPVGATIVPKVATPGNGKGGLSFRTTPEQVGAIVRAQVTNTRPLLLPSAPPTWAYDADVTLDADSFDVVYQSDLRDRSVGLSITIPSGSAAGANSSQTLVKFRGVTATYVVFDPSSPTSYRWLMWAEPGTMTNAALLRPGGVPYVLGATGLTDQEFWQVANSLR